MMVITLLRLIKENFLDYTVLPDNAIFYSKKKKCFYLNTGDIRLTFIRTRVEIYAFFVIKRISLAVVRYIIRNR